MKNLREFAERQTDAVQESQREQFATLTLNTAVELTGAALGQLDVSGAPDEQAIALQADNPRWWYHLAALRRNTGDQDGALAALDRVTELDATYVPAHWQRGFHLLELGRSVEAESSFRRAIELNPADPTGSVGLAVP